MAHPSKIIRNMHTKQLKFRYVENIARCLVMWYIIVFLFVNLVSSKFLGSYKSADGDCTNEIKRHIAMVRQKAVELTTIWKDKNVTSALKIRVMKSMVWAVFQYGLEGWTLKKSNRNRIESFEMLCWRNMLGISWKEHRTNISILDEIGLERELMGKVAQMKLQYFGHVTRGSAGNLALSFLEGRVDGLRHQGRPKRQWMDDIEEWSGCSYIQLKEMSQDREQWKRKTIE